MLLKCSFCKKTITNSVHIAELQNLTENDLLHVRRMLVNNHNRCQVVVNESVLNSCGEEYANEELVAAHRAIKIVDVLLDSLCWDKNDNNE